jgi:hypothetical protein
MGVLSVWLFHLEPFVVVAVNALVESILVHDLEKDQDSSALLTVEFIFGDFHLAPPLG